MIIGIYGGTFNPFHIGHGMVASYVAQSGLVDELWVMPTPCNPLKSNADGQSGSSPTLDNRHRLECVKRAVEGFRNVKVCDLEYHLPSPHYTIDTLRELEKRFPQHQFRIVVGGDNWELLPKWKSADEIIRDFGIIVYPRPGSDIDLRLQLIAISPELLEYQHRVTVLSDAPQALISSSFIRNLIVQGGDATGFVDPRIVPILNEGFNLD